MTPAELLDRELRRGAARPLLTWYDDRSGARVELSVATAANWAAKVANLLVDEHDLEPGDAVGVPQAAHWISAVTMLGVWLAGGAVVDVDTVHDLDVGLDDLGVGLSTVVAAQPDFYAGLPGDANDVGLVLQRRRWTHAELGAAAAHGAHQHHLQDGARVLSTLDYSTVDGVDAGLLVPLAAGGSVVLVAHADAGKLSDRAAVEHVTHTAGVSIDGLPRLC